jgi:hypothetical protein
MSVASGGDESYMVKKVTLLHRKLLDLDSSPFNYLTF